MEGGDAVGVVGVVGAAWLRDKPLADDGDVATLLSSCFEEDPSASNDFAFVDLLPGDPSTSDDSSSSLNSTRITGGGQDITSSSPISSLSLIS